MRPITDDWYIASSSCLSLTQFCDILTEDWHNKKPQSSPLICNLSDIMSTFISSQITRHPESNSSYDHKITWKVNEWFNVVFVVDMKNIKKKPKISVQIYSLEAINF